MNWIKDAKELLNIKILSSEGSTKKVIEKPRLDTTNGLRPIYKQKEIMLTI